MRARILWAATFALLLFGLAVGPSSGAGASGRPVMPSSNWSVVASMPQDIYGAATASNGVFSYALGGYSTSTGTTLDTFYRYNPVNERWETRLAMPAAVAMASAVYVPTSDRIYVFGGFDPNTSVFSDATRVFDLATGTWDTAANMPAPRAFMASGYNTANGKIYLVGGNDSADPASAKATTWEYDPAADTFTTRAPIPHAVGGSAFGVIGGHFYLAGGLDALGAVVDLTWDYNIAANSWAAKTAMPSPTNAAGSAAASGKLWSFGGESASGPVDMTESYDPATDTWTSGPSLSGARTLVGGTAIGSTLVAAGGSDGTSSTARTEVLDAGSASCVNPTTTFSENFDGVTPPALPAGWTATNAEGPAPPWQTSNSGMPTPPADTPPNAAFVDNPQVVSDKRLDSPSIPISTSAAQLTFRNNYYTETTFDGGVLEISIGGGAFRDIRDAGGTLVVGTYDGTLQTGLGNPLSGRLAWTGNSNNGFVTSVAILPASAAGQNVVLRWRLGSDMSAGAPGWRIDSIKITAAATASSASASATATASSASASATATASAASSSSSGPLPCATRHRPEARRREAEDPGEALLGWQGAQGSLEAWAARPRDQPVTTSRLGSAARLRGQAGRRPALRLVKNEGWTAASRPPLEVPTSVRRRRFGGWSAG